MAESITESTYVSVLGTVELLEHMLLQLPPTDVVRSRRVHSIWRATIAGSLPLRQHIILDPTPIKHIITIHKEGLSAEHTRTSTNATLRTSTKSSCLCTLCLLDDVATLGSHYETMVCAVDIDVSKFSRLTGKEWRSMFITNPPAKDIDNDIDS